eukprot:Gb_34142 [translate_table: standard]
MEEVKVFVVGVGALACKFLKNLALMRASCGSQGKLTMTVATSVATKIDPYFQVEALQNRVSLDIENVFDDTFKESLGVVINSLDNVNVRLYIDSRCLYFKNPLLEFGTLGTKCNTQMVEFEIMLEKTPSEANAFLSKLGGYKPSLKSTGDGQARVLLECVIERLVTKRCVTFEDWLAWVQRKFGDYFANHVKQLTFTFPENVATSIFPDWALNSKKLAEEVDKVQRNTMYSVALLATSNASDSSMLTLNILSSTQKWTFEYKPNAGSFGHMDSVDAILCLLKVPMLSDLDELSHWDWLDKSKKEEILEKLRVSPKHIESVLITMTKSNYSMQGLH